MSAQPTSDQQSINAPPAIPSLSLLKRRWIAALSIGPAALILLKLAPSLDTILFEPIFHLVIVTLCSLIALGLALVIMRAAQRYADGRALLVGTAFLAIAAIFLIHAVATPNVLLANRFVAVTWSALFSLVLGGLIFALSGLDFSPKVNSWLIQHFWRWLSGLGLLWLAYSIVVLFIVPLLDHTIEAGYAPGEALSPHIDMPDGTELGLTMPFGSIGLAAFAFAIYRHLQLYRQQPDAAHLATLGGIGLLSEALLTQVFSTSYSLLFWLYHLLELAGCIAVASGLSKAMHGSNGGASMIESLLLPSTTVKLRTRYVQALERMIELLESGELPDKRQLAALRQRFDLSESQMAVFVQAATAVAEERQRRHMLETLNEGLRRLDRDREQLIQMIIHDLKNPITAIMGYLDLMHLSEPVGEQAELISGARRSALGLEGLVSDLLDLGRLENGQLEPQCQLFSVADLLTGCAESLRIWNQQQNQQILVSVAPNLPLLYADRRLIERLVLNLLSNAIKHTPPGTTIQLQSAHCMTRATAAGQFTITVADNGPGIPYEQQATIFNKYATLRAPASEQPSQRNTGLGLTFCRLVAEAHGGSIVVESQLGAGTTFRVSLPQHADEVTE